MILIKNYKILIAIFVICLLRLDSFSQGWFQLNSGVIDNLYSVYFINTSTGFTVGNDKILKTTNGGLNWNFQIIPSVQLRAIQFINSSTGYTVGSFGVVLKTTNGGVNWIHTDAGLQGDLYSLFFLDAQTGFISANLETGLILKTTNGGTNWGYVLIGGLIPYDIYFINSMTGFASYSPGYLNKSTNGGNSWFVIPTGTSSSVYSLQFINEMTGYAAGSAVIKTTNGGNNWAIQLSGNIYPYFYSIFFLNANKGYTAGALNITNNFIMSTTDGGSNWYSQYSSPGLLLSLFFADSITGYCVGENGLILKTTTGGVTFIKQVSGAEPKSFSLDQNYPNPFNPTTKIKFALPKSKFAKLVIYDILGREAATLVNEQLKPGTYEADWNASNFPSGVYFYKLITNGFADTRKMILIK